MSDTKLRKELAEWQASLAAAGYGYRMHAATAARALQAILDRCPPEPNPLEAVPEAVDRIELQKCPSGWISRVCTSTSSTSQGERPTALQALADIMPKVWQYEARAANVPGPLPGYAVCCQCGNPNAECRTDVEGTGSTCAYITCSRCGAKYTHAVTKE